MTLTAGISGIRFRIEVLKLGNGKITDSPNEENQMLEDCEDCAVDRKRESLLSLYSLMTKRLLTIFILLAMAANVFAVIPVHTEAASGCSEGCCAAAMQHDATPESVAAALCCALNCQQEAEQNSPTILLVTPQKPELKACTALRQITAVCQRLRQIRFPSSPTRHLAGSSARYLENSSFLI